MDQQNERAPVPTGPRSLRTVTQIPGASGVTNATIQAVTCYRLSPDPISRSKDMSIPAVAADRTLAINLNQPGTLLHWSIFDVSVANLVLIAVMVVIFGVALLIPFPDGHRIEPAPAAVSPATYPTWPPRTRTRRCGRRGCVAGRCGCCRRASCCPTASPGTWRRGSTCSAWPRWPRSAWSIVSGFALALGGPDWWHYNPVGHFFNSLHLWSVELFMALLVIHLWGEVLDGRLARPPGDDLDTGVVAFLASIVECFTGYVSQQNFDSQWISTSGKDAFNSVGRRRVLQRDELRPDADVAHRAGPDHPGRGRRRARADGPGPRGGAPDRRRGRWTRRGKRAAGRPPPRTPRRGAALPAATTS